MTALLVGTMPVALADGTNHLNTTLPLLINELGNAEDPVATAKSKVIQLASNYANEQLDEAAQSAVENTNLTHLNLTLGTDSFGLDSGTSSMTEVIGVYRLYEKDNLFIFNQSSWVNFDSRNTLNTGFGVRSINADDTVIVGINAFYDQELDSNHKRSSVGVEAINSKFDLRANYYQAISGQVTYQGINETALDGHDYRLAFELPYMYSSNVYVSGAKWKDNASYSIKTREWGVEAEPFPNVIFKLGQQEKDGGTAKTVGSVRISGVFGAEANKAKRSGDWTTGLESVRYKLYEPVERENRIAKKAIKLGVTVSGY